MSILETKESTFTQESYKETYKRFTRTLINRSFEWKNKHINILLEDAMRHLGELNAYNELVPGIEAYNYMLLVREVVSSNQIEGIKSDYHTAFQQKNKVDKPYEKDYQEIHNYLDSMQWAVEELKTYQLSLRLIKRTHQILFNDHHHSPHLAGKLRYNEAFINRQSIHPEYIPPDKKELKVLIQDSKQFWKNDELILPQLIKTAMTMYQFEIMLPFVDGNGRTARTLVILELLSLMYLQKPNLTISVYFNQNRMEYYHRMNMVRNKNDIEQWIQFFLLAVRESAKENKKLLQSAMALKKEYEKLINEKAGKKRKEQVLQLVEYMFQNPVVTVNQISELLKISFQAANKLVTSLVEIDLLRETSAFKRNRSFYLWKYYSLFEI